MDEKGSRRKSTGVDYSGFTVASIINNHMKDVNGGDAQGGDAAESTKKGALPSEEGKDVDEFLDLTARELFFDEDKVDGIESNSRPKHPKKASEEKDILDLDDEVIESHEKKIRGESEPVSPLAEDDILRSDDFVLSEDDDAAIVKQLLDGTVSWYIDGLYNEEGKTHHSIYLKENPPLFIIEASDGREASFILTKELSRTFSKTFGDLNKAYYGSRKKRGEKSFDDKVKGIPDWARKNPIQAIFTFLLVFAFFALLVVTAF